MHAAIERRVGELVARVVSGRWCEGDATQAWCDHRSTSTRLRSRWGWYGRELLGAAVFLPSRTAEGDSDGVDDASSSGCGGCAVMVAIERHV